MFPYIDHFVVSIPDKPPLLHHMAARSNLKRRKKRLYYINAYVAFVFFLN